MAEFKLVTDAEFKTKQRTSSVGLRAISASTDETNRRIVMELSNGVSVAFPIDQIQGLEGVALEDLVNVKVQGRGFGLHVPTIDADISVACLFANLLGSNVMVQAERRAIASRANGHKGGRPKDSAKTPAS
jgi:hypothetical protein